MESSPAEVWREHAVAGRLAFQRDAEGMPVWPPRTGPYEWGCSGGTGTVYATTTMRPRGAEPSDLSVVELDEGFRMVSRVRGGGTVGLRVRLVWGVDGVAEFEPS